MRVDSQPRIVPPSRRLLSLFSLYLSWYLRRHFHALRVANAQRFPDRVTQPLIFYLNHPSWWDPLACIMISRRFLPGADHYAPMDEAALAHYGFFARMGLFPVEIDTARGAIQFLRSARQVLATPNSALWLTPEGRFTDPRPQPAVFKDGLATLLARLPSVTLVPLAIEYVFWNERLPEILVNCGQPIHSNNGDKCTSDEWNEGLTAALAAAQRELAALAIARDPAPFEPLLVGAAGVGVFYDLWQRLRSASRGARYTAEHGSIHRS
jgi:1-acyl-sn-glycerol-3-phosphate acyltransferase